MIRPPARRGVAFTERVDGDLRNDMPARVRVARHLQIPESWATVRQVHGNVTRRVESPGMAGEADALWTTTPGLPLAVFTADCFGVVLHAENAVGIAHAGWRGTVGRVVERLRDDMDASGHAAIRAELGPGIRSCCFEVGPEVAERFEHNVSETTWGTTSVDLPAAIVEQLPDLDVWTAFGCTHHEDRWFSHRREGTAMRLATIGWVP